LILLIERANAFRRNCAFLARISVYECAALLFPLSFHLTVFILRLFSLCAAVAAESP